MRSLLISFLILFSLNLHAYEKMTVQGAQACTILERDGKEACMDIPIRNLVLDFGSYWGQLWWTFSFEIQPTPLNPKKVLVNLPLALGNFAGCYNHIGGSGGDDKNDYKWNKKVGLISLDFSKSASWHGNWGFERSSMKIDRSAELKTATISYTHSCDASQRGYEELRYLIHATID